MFYRVILLLLVLFCFNNLSAQKLIEAYEKGGTIVAKMEGGKIKNVAKGNDVNLIGYSISKNLLVYKKLEQSSKTDEIEDSHDQYSLRCFNFTTNAEKLLFTTCLDMDGGTKPSYAGSEDYPFDYLCGFDTGILAKDGTLLYFQTDAWTVSPAIHCYDLTNSKLTFFYAGWLKKATRDGVEIVITGLDREKNGQSKGRYVQRRLYDFNGKLIKNLTGKEF